LAEALTLSSFVNVEPRKSKPAPATVVNEVNKGVFRSKSPADAPMVTEAVVALAAAIPEEAAKIPLLSTVMLVASPAVKTEPKVVCSTGVSALEPPEVVFKVTLEALSAVIIEPVAST